MKTSWTAAAFLTALLALTVGAAPASAQFFSYGWRAPVYAPRPYYAPRPFYGERYGLRAGDVHRMLAEEGYNVIGVYRNGRVFVADVFGPRGRDRLIVDGASGRIVQSFATGQRQTARLIPPADVEPRVIPGFHEPKSELAVRPRASARVPVAPKPRAVAPARAKPAPSYAARPASALKHAAPAATPAPPASEAVKAGPIEVSPPAAAEAPAARTAQPSNPVNDVPVAPLDDVAPRTTPKSPVNDVPVAPLD